MMINPDYDAMMVNDLIDYLQNWLDRTDFGRYDDGEEVRDKHKPVDLLVAYLPVVIGHFRGTEIQKEEES